ncbi:unnamed protein product, partial [Staurois parvus]
LLSNSFTPSLYHASTTVTPSSLASLTAGYPLFNSSTLLTVLYLPSLSANPSTGLHSVSSTPLCQSLYWPPLSVLHPSLPITPLTSIHVLHPSLPIPPLASTQCPSPSLPIPPLASTQCPPPLSANPSTSLHSVSSIPLCQSLHWLLIAQHKKFK